MQVQNAPAGAALAVSPGTNILGFGEVNGPAVIIAYVPNLTALAAAEVVTLQISTVGAAPVVVGAGIFTNSGAGASTGGPLIAAAPIAGGAAASGYSVAIFASVATGAWVSTATNPAFGIVLP
jgi:hypothetical protein